MIWDKSFIFRTNRVIPRGARAYCHEDFREDIARRNINKMSSKITSASEGVVNGPSKNPCLAKFKADSRGLVVSYFYGEPSRSLDFFFNAKEVSGSQKMYQSRCLAKSRIYHSTPLSEVNTGFLSSVSIPNLRH